MTYTLYDKSADKGSPYELFTFLCATGNYYYTNNGEKVTYEGNEYSPLQITRGVLEFNAVTDSVVTTQITVPNNCQLFYDHGRGLVHPDMSVEVRRFHRGTTGSRLRSAGRVISHSVANERYTLEIANTVQTEVQRSVAPVYYDTKCNHVLGDARCKINRALFSKATHIMAITDYTVTVENDGHSNGALVGGEIVVGGERHTILDNQDNLITLAYPFVEAKAGDDCTLYRDCDRMFTTCRDVFNNELQYGGYPLLPTVNPAQPDLEIINQTDKLSQIARSDDYVTNYGGLNGSWIVRTPRPRVWR